MPIARCLRHSARCRLICSAVTLLSMKGFWLCEHEQLHSLHTQYHALSLAFHNTSVLNDKGSVAPETKPSLSIFKHRCCTVADAGSLLLES